MKPKARKPRYSRDAHYLDEQGRKYSLWWITPGIASEFIHHLADLVAEHPGLPVVLYCRVSSIRQLRDGNLKEAVAKAKAELEAMGCKVIAVFEEMSHSSIYFVNDKPG